MIKRLKNIATVSALTGLILAGVGGVSAMSVDLKVGQVLGKDEAAVTSMLTAAGYSGIEFETEDGELEVEAVKDGVEVEFEISSTTGRIMSIELDDADDSEDQD